MNGTKLSKDKEYSVIINNMTNPLDPGTMKFTITTYHDSDIYMQKIICSQKVPFPFIQRMPIR
jgi:hypothetical protein